MGSATGGGLFVASHFSHCVHHACMPSRGFAVPLRRPGPPCAGSSAADTAVRALPGGGDGGNRRSCSTVEGTTTTVGLPSARADGKQQGRRRTKGRKEESEVRKKDFIQGLPCRIHGKTLLRWTPSPAQSKNPVFKLRERKRPLTATEAVRATSGQAGPSPTHAKQLKRESMVARGWRPRGFPHPAAQDTGGPGLRNHNSI